MAKKEQVAPEPYDLDAFNQIVVALEPFDSKQQSRILRTAAAFYGIEL